MSLPKACEQHRLHLAENVVLTLTRVSQKSIEFKRRGLHPSSAGSNLFGLAQANKPKKILVKRHPSKKKMKQHTRVQHKTMIT